MKQYVFEYVYILNGFQYFSFFLYYRKKHIIAFDVRLSTTITINKNVTKKPVIFAKVDLNEGHG